MTGVINEIKKEIDKQVNKFKQDTNKQQIEEDNERHEMGVE
jgi:hypothetical protein